MSGGQSLMGRKGKHLDDEILSNYIDGTLSDRERVAVERHITTCAQCARDLETLQQTVLLLRDLPAVKVPRAFTLSEADISPQTVRRRPLFGFLRSATVAVAMLLAVVITGDVLVQQGLATLPPIFEGASAPAPAAMPQAEMASERTSEPAAPMAKMLMVEPSTESDTQMVEKVVRETVVVEKEIAVEEEAVKEIETEVIVTVEVEKAITVQEAPVQENSIAANTEEPVFLPTPQSDTDAASVPSAQIAEVTGEPAIAPTLSEAERMIEAPAPDDVEPGEDGGEGGMGIGGMGGGIGGGPEESAVALATAEWEMENAPPAVLRPTETPTATPLSQPTMAPTMEPSRSQPTETFVIPPSRSATAVAERAGTPNEPTPIREAYGLRYASQSGIPLIRLVEIALLLIVLALVSATVASRQRRN